MGRMQNIADLTTNEGFATAVTLYLHRPQPDNRKRALNSFATSLNSSAPSPQSMDEKFLLPSRSRHTFGVFAGPDEKPKTDFIVDLMARHKDLPINYGEIPETGTCVQQLAEALIQACNLKEERRPNWIQEFLAPDPEGDESRLSGLISSILAAAGDYQRQMMKLQPVVVINKFERLEGCPREIEKIMSAAKTAASNRQLTFIFATSSKQNEQTILDHCDKTRHHTHTFGDPGPPRIALSFRDYKAYESQASHDPEDSIFQKQREDHNMYAEDYSRHVVTEDYLNGWSYNATTPGSHPVDPCGGSYIQLGDWTITRPALVPTCLLAAAIGISCGLKIKRSNGPSSSAYSKSFFMFACMMTDAMIFHCFLHDSVGSLGSLISGIMDVGLTSSIGLSFGFNALFDMGIMKDSLKSSLIMFGSYALMIGAWVYAMVNQIHNSFMILYLGVVAVSCGLYSIITLIRVIQSKGVGLKWLLIGVGYGAFGLAAVFYSPLARALCAVFTKYFNSEFWWFFLSDLSMYYLYKYYMASHVNTQKTSSVNYDSDYESDEEEEESDEEVQRLVKPRTTSATAFRLVPQQQQQQQVVYIPMPYYPTTATNAYYMPQTAPVYYY